MREIVAADFSCASRGRDAVATAPRVFTAFLAWKATFSGYRVTESNADTLKELASTPTVR